jgi:hypothetical protein
VTALSRLLRKEISRKHGKVGTCDIWMDHRMAAGDVIDASLDAEVRGGAAMLIVLSPGYLESSWCKREMDLFLEADAKRQAGSTSRVFVIETGRVERPEAPAMVLSLPFWAASPDNLEITSQLGYPRPNADTPDLALAEQLRRTLEKMGAWVSLPYSGDKDEETNPRAYNAGPGDPGLSDERLPGRCKDISPGGGAPRSARPLRRAGRPSSPQERALHINGRARAVSGPEAAEGPVW